VDRLFRSPGPLHGARGWIKLGVLPTVFNVGTRDHRPAPPARSGAFAVAADGVSSRSGGEDAAAPDGRARLSGARCPRLYAGRVCFVSRACPFSRTQGDPPAIPGIESGCGRGAAGAVRGGRQLPSISATAWALSGNGRMECHSRAPATTRRWSSRKRLVVADVQARETRRRSAMGLLIPASCE